MGETEAETDRETETETEAEGKQKKSRSQKYVQIIRFLLHLSRSSRCGVDLSVVKCDLCACGQSMRVSGTQKRLTEFTACVNSVMVRLVGISQQRFFHNDSGQQAILAADFFLRGVSCVFFQMSAAPPLASSKTPSNCCHFQRDNCSGVLIGLIRRLFFGASFASTGLYPKNV